MKELLRIEDLSVAFGPHGARRRVTEGVSLSVGAGEKVALVGESGSGKSVTALSVLRLHDPQMTGYSGRIHLEGRDLLRLTERELRRVRGRDVAMVFQEPMTSLNPVYPISEQLIEPLTVHIGLDRVAARARAIELLGRVGLPDPGQRIDAFPHMLSGGQRQRVMIAIALSCKPDILIADEPTTALDVTIQDQILELIQTLVQEEGMALILISHDLGVISENTDNILVMYGGAAVEMGRTERIFDELVHPYTQGLFAAMPKLGRARSARLVTIPGTVPDLINLPVGCTFTDRCPLATELCRDVPPPPVEVEAGHMVACHHREEARRRKTEELFS